jgi:hypothetical protein
LSIFSAERENNVLETKISCRRRHEQNPADRRLINAASAFYRVDMNMNCPFRRWLLIMLSASVIFGAVIGVAIVMLDSWGWLEIRIALTTIALGIGSLCGLACDYSRRPNANNVLPWAGILLTLVATSMSLVGFWLDVRPDAFWKTLCVVIAVGSATAISSILSLARLARRFAWVFVVSVATYYVLAGFITYAIIAENDDDSLMRTIGVLSIIATAFTLLTPLLHRISRMDDIRDDSSDIPSDWSVTVLDQEIRTLRARLATLEERKARLISES